MNEKIAAIFCTILVAMSLSGVAYSHWSDTVNIMGTVEMAHLEIVIGSEKVLSPHNDRITVSKPDKQTLQIIAEDVSPCWYVWIGLLIHNEGILPAEAKEPVITFEDPDNLQDYIDSYTYFYGPHTGGDHNSYVWGSHAKLENLPDDGDEPLFPAEPVEPPVPIDPCQHVVTWTWVHFDTDDNSMMGKTIKIFITIVDDFAI
jgi:hypothetical protein